MNGPERSDIAASGGAVPSEVRAGVLGRAHAGLAGRWFRRWFGLSLEEYGTPHAVRIHELLGRPKSRMGRKVPKRWALSSGVAMLVLSWGAVFSAWYFTQLPEAVGLAGVFLGFLPSVATYLAVGLHHANVVLAEDFRAYRNGVDAGIIVSMTDEQGTIIFGNEKFVSISGYSQEELVGKSHSIVNSGFHSDDFFHDMWSTIKKGQVWRGEICNRTKEGQVYWVDAVIVRIADNSGGQTRYLSFRNDITERKLAEASLGEAKIAAEAANAAKSRFLATMSHEIRTPMNGILGMAQMLMTPSLSEQERREYAGIVLDSGKVLLRLLDDILSLSKIEAGRMELLLSDFSPAALADEVIHLFSISARRKGLKLETVWNGPVEQRYRADSIRLRQMLTNLVDNAIKFTDYGLIEVLITERQRTADRAALEFSVRDTGPGISSEDVKRLFQPFSQTSGQVSQSLGGAGLGLSIVRQLAELMAGEAGVSSAPGKGSHFWFRVEVEPVASDIPVPLVPHAISKTKGLALVVEDDPTNSKVIEAMLSRSGLDFMIERNGQLALDKLTDGTFRPDLVFMDCRMPVMDGFATTQRFRAWERRRGRERVPIIALTAGTFEEDKAAAFAVGMDDFVSKPIDIARLAEVIENWIKRPAP